MTTKVPGWYLMIFGLIVAGGWLVTIIATAVADRPASPYVHVIMGIVATGLFGTGFAKARNGIKPPIQGGADG